MVAILGRNGCGKSTFLKIVSGIIEPTEGTVEVRGKVASILELSMGFHNDLTGRENIFLRSELYGIPRAEVAKNLEKIITYSDLGKFIDNPVRTYSSGMRSRLAFAIMVNVDAEVFLVDEALSTGDAAFSSKASEHLKDLVRNGKTVMLTSHNMRTIKATCNRAVWIDDHRIAMDGPAEEVCDAYNRSIVESFEDTLKLAEGGSSAAQYRLAGYYHHGVYTERDPERYRFWLSQAATRDHVPAMCEYADILMSEDPVGNRDEALALYKASADGGSFDARRRYSNLRAGSDDDFVAVKNVLADLSRTGYPSDLCEYATVLSTTAISDDDREQAFDMFCKAADAGSAEAFFRKGMMLHKGFGTERSESKAVEALEAAAALGHSKAMVVLADMYMDGTTVERDPAKAYRWYLLSAETGNPRSQYQVATMLSSGIGVEKDEDEADLWYRRHSASELNGSRMYALEMIDKRRGARRPETPVMYEEAADSGNLRAIAKLAYMRETGKEVTKDVTKASALYDTLEKGPAKGRGAAASAHLEGRLGESDLERAFTLYKQAADNGDVKAMYPVACMYRDGIGVQEDRELYKFYTRMASDFGNKEAQAIVRKWDAKEKKRRRKEGAS